MATPDLLVPGGLDPALLERGHVRVEQYGSLLRVTLDRPDARNAQTPATWTALAAVGDVVLGSPEIDAVVLSGSGPSFSAGLDRRMFTPEGIPGEMSLLSLARAGDEELEEYIAAAQAAFTWWRACDAITFALVQGHAIGAGFQLALACDILIAAPDAQFAMRETSYGLVPDLAGTSTLVRAVGHARALEICATGRSVSAEEAYRLGLVTRIHENLDDAAEEMLAALGAAPPGAVRELTRLLRDAHERTAEEQRAAERRAQSRRLRSLLAAIEG